jgi:hypothetical protein
VEPPAQIKKKNQQAKKAAIKKAPKKTAEFLYNKKGI